MREFIATRRFDIYAPPARRSRTTRSTPTSTALAWSDEAIRWLLSTLPSCMIFDDHDIRDDWNTSWTWHEEINRTPWWHERLMGGLSAYWVYQHLGNLPPRSWRATRSTRERSQGLAPGPAPTVGRGAGSISLTRSSTWPGASTGTPRSTAGATGASSATAVSSSSTRVPLPPRARPRPSLDARP